MISVARVMVSWLAALGLFACSAAHTNTSTETENPPVIDIGRISLVVSAGDVRVVGEPGAVAPAAAEVEIEIEVVATGELTQVRPNADGSFEIAIDANSDVVVAVRATHNGQSSQSVYVTRGGATVGSDTGGTLSCAQRSQLASQAIGSAATNADASCRTAADCAAVPLRTSCTDSCGDAIVSSGSVAELEDAVSAVNDGLCSGFAADGCSVQATPCPSPIGDTIACVDGRCTLDTGKENDCPSCLNRTVEWNVTDNPVKFSLSGCGTLTIQTLGETPCITELAHCGSDTTPAIEALIRMLDTEEVQAALVAGEAIGGPVPAGTSSIRIRVDGREFVACTASPCRVPLGIFALAQTLFQIRQEAQCPPPTCLPNARFVEDLCGGCDPAGGCSETGPQCTLVCSDSAVCQEQSRSLFCSSRGICEFGQCR